MSQLGKRQSQVGAGGGAGRGKGNQPDSRSSYGANTRQQAGGGGGRATGRGTRHTSGQRDQAHHIFAHDIRTKHLLNTHTHTHTHTPTHSHTHRRASALWGGG
jgi:hypothetical protein